MPVLSRWFRRAASEAVRPGLPTPAADRATVPEPPTALADEAAVGQVIDAAAALVQLVGTCAHDTEQRRAEETRHEAARWRRHLMTGLDHPAATPDDPAPHARGGGLGDRDWTGAVRWATATRRAERAHVASTTDTLRDTVWTLVRGLDDVVGADAEAGRHERTALRRVREAVSEADPAALRDVALAAIGELASLLADRERARERQLDTLGRRIAQLDGALEEARRDGATDALTGLGNRRAFDAAVEHAVALHRLLGQRVCLVSIDADGLKRINDTHGHSAGDAALRVVARQLSRVFLRRSDVAVRNGGDEFAVLLRDTSLDDAARLVQRLVDEVARAPVPLAAPDGAAADGADVEAAAPGELHGVLGISAGVALLGPEECAADWLARADAALYAAKRGGRGRVAVSS